MAAGHGKTAMDEVESHRAHLVTTTQRESAVIGPRVCDAGKCITIELLADSSDRTLTYDANWVIFGTSVTTVSANKRVIITLKCNSTTAASVRGIAVAQV